MAAPSRTADKFMLRLPDGMRDEIEATARANGRSMNAEIVLRLQQSLSGPTGTPHPSLQQALDAYGGDVRALLASEALRLRELLERLEASALPPEKS